MDNLFIFKLYELVKCIIIFFIIHYFYNHYFICRFRKKSYIILVYLLFFLLGILIYNISLSDITYLISYIIIIISLSFIYKGNLKWKISSALFLIVIIAVCDLISISFYVKDTIVILNQTIFLMPLLVLIFFRIVKSFGERSLKVFYWILLFFSPIISLLILYYLTSNYFFHVNIFLLVIISTMILIINFLIFILCDRVLLVQYEQDKNMLIEKQNAYYLNQYLMTKEMYEESSKIQHDFKNILIGLKGKMERNENEKNTIEIDRIIGNYEMKNIFCNSGNIIIDSIINYKEQVAKKYQIPFSYELDIPSNLKLDTKIISVIMGNSLDNALEACQKFENSDCYININIQYLNESLYVRIENPYIKKIHKNFRGDISTIKSNKKIHGIGLKNIKKTLEEINGILDISYENNLFQIEFVLFNIKKD